MRRHTRIITGLALAGLLLAFNWLYVRFQCLFAPKPEPLEKTRLAPGGTAHILPANSSRAVAPEKKAAEEAEVCTAFIDCNGI